MNNNYYVYILTNKYKTVFYTGVTNDLYRRTFEHKTKLSDGFSEKYNAVRRNRRCLLGGRHDNLKSKFLI